ncbi:MAG: cytochrome c3 family protein [Deltaproteobacteria bacterium]|nr:cytochrome c3 family protein [Deltaproteobacteria bacterium]
MQIFPRELNYLPLIGALGAAIAGGVVVFVFWYFFSPKNLQVGYSPEQPINYSHALHAGDLGIDCRYCHANVETSQEAMIPPTQTCMGCHAVVEAPTEAGAEELAKLRGYWERGEAIPWVRVHKLTETAYFDHSAHLASGVGCVSCHGRVDQMEVVGVREPLAMGWCLECHRDPEPSLRPPSRVTDMDWEPGDEAEAALIADISTISPPEHCSGCHR